MNMKFQQMINMMDPTQKQAIMTKMAGLMPSAQLAFMKKLVDGGTDMILPPSKEELSEWKGLYLSYFDSSKTVK